MTRADRRRKDSITAARRSRGSVALMIFRRDREAYSKSAKKILRCGRQTTGPRALSRPPAHTKGARSRGTTRITRGTVRATVQSLALMGRSFTVPPSSPSQRESFPPRKANSRKRNRRRFAKGEKRTSHAMSALGQKRTSTASLRMSALGQERTWRTLKAAGDLNDAAGIFRSLSAATIGGLAGVLMHRPAHSKSVIQTIVGAHYLRRGLRNRH